METLRQDLPGVRAFRGRGVVRRTWQIFGCLRTGGYEAALREELPLARLQG